jgi:hypothetical protein
VPCFVPSCLATSMPDLPRCSMSLNPIGEVGAAALSEALKSNATLTELQ